MRAMNLLWWFARARSAASLTRTGPVIGLFPESAFGLQETTLGDGDLFFAYTDGVPDALDAQGDCFGEERLLSLLSSGVSAEALLRGLAEQLNRHIGDAKQYDDVTMLAVRRLVG